MTENPVLNGGTTRRITVLAIFLMGQAAGSATDWPQYRGPTTDGISPDPILTSWPTNGPPVVWRNSSISNGFSCLVVSQGRAFAMKSIDAGGNNFSEYCVAVDTATGTNIWSTLVDSAPWDPSVNYNGGDGTAPYNTGDGPRSTPSVKDGRVFALSGLLHLVCMNVTNGTVLWNNDLPGTYGGSIIQYENCASPCLDNDLIFVNLNTAFNNQTLMAFRSTNGSKAWSSQNEYVTHTTPVVTTLQGVRQVIFATTTGLVSVNRDTGTFLWKFQYPFPAIGTSMGAGPVVYSNLVYCTAGYNKGAAAARVTLANGVWTVTQLYYKNAAAGQAYRSIWMTPVCYQGYIYTLCGENTTFLTTPLSCIELSTGNLKWSTNNFGMGGIILVNSNLLVLTEKGDVVLAQCNPNAYTEEARYHAFTFSASLPGKCWNNPTYGDGRIYAHSTREGVALNVAVTTTPPVAPDLTTVGASNVTTTTAMLYGTVNPNGATTGAWFQWGLTSGYGNTTTPTSNLTGTSPLSVTNMLSGLAPGTTYHFRITATNSAGTTNGADAIFATLPSPLPGLATVGASNVTTTTATLYGTVNPSGATTGAWFQWGLTSGYGNTTTPTSNLNGNTTISVTSTLNGLTPATTYHFRIVATNSAGTTNGADATLTTVQPAPVIAIQPLSRAGLVGSSPSFSVLVTNTPTNGYQWRFFGSNLLAGRTSSTLTMTNVQATNFGDYTVQVSNNGGAVTSAVAHLTHAVSPSITSNKVSLQTMFLTFSTEFGPAYFVDYESDLASQAWTPLTNVPGTGSPITITDQGTTNDTRFYRIRLQ